jgi:hypothetical protein
MSPTRCRRSIAMVAIATALSISQSSYGGLLLNYQFETVDGDPPSGQTTPDSSGNFTSVAGSVNAVLGHGSQTPGVDFPNLISGPVQIGSGTKKSRNPASAMNFPGNPATGNIASSIERVEIADAASAALDATFSNFTVALWLNPSSSDRDRFAIGKIGGSGQRGWQISSPNGSTNLVIDYFNAAGGSDRSLVLPGALPLNTWTHVIFAFDGVNQSEAVYINNSLQSPTSVGTLTSVPTTLNAANNQPLRVGHRGATGNSVGAWAGGIDDVRIFNETLTHTTAGSSTGTGSTLVPEPGAMSMALIAIAAAAAIGKRRA